jgi:hypothetical protein
LRLVSDESGAVLLDELHAVLLKYVIMPNAYAADAVTLWTAATHAQDAWEHATRLVITAPEKRCGKSRLLDVIEATCHKPLITVNISAAALVRSIGAKPPTLLVDEADTIFGKKAADQNEDLRGIINAGHQRNRPYIRWDATARMAEECPTFSMAALAGIGDMPDTIMDRSVVVRMRRRGPGETVKPYRRRRDGVPLGELRARLGQWAAGYLDRLTKAEPDMPVEDRAADTWEPLIAIADLAGGEWPRRARLAALKLVTAESEADAEASLGMKLLGDIRDIFADLSGVSFLTSQELLARLHKIEESPWKDFELTPRGLSDKLRPYGVKPGHNQAKTARGYQLIHFQDAFARYLASGTVQESDKGSDQ